MIRLLLFLSLLAIVHCSCPTGFELVSEGECRGIYENSLFYYFDETYAVAADICDEIQGLLPIIHNEEHQSYWSKQKNTNLLIIGLVCNTTTLVWEWTDGSPVDFKPAEYDLGLDSDCTEGEGKVWFIYDNGTWAWGEGHDLETFDVYCTTQLHQPIPSPDGCESFSDDKEDGECYQIGTIAESWRDAQLICEKLGANLASIHNVNENSFIRRLAVSKGSVNGVFIGVTVFGMDTLGWMDGSDWDYSNFAPGFPNPDYGECVVLDTSSSSGLWKNVECDAKLPVACIREQNSGAERNATCSSQVWEEGALITSPGFPYDASVPCAYDLSVREGQKLKFEIVLLEANSCCDSLLIYEGDQLIMNLTGEMHNFTYTANEANTGRVQWVPNGGVNVRGVAFTFRGV